MIDPSAFHRLSYGLYLVTACTKEGKKVGCVANTFQQVASKPPMASVSLNKENATTQAILETGAYAVSVLDQAATMELIGLFGFKSSHDVDKFADVQHEICGADIPLVLAHCAAAFTVSVREQVDVGTHIMFVGPVEEAKALSDAAPMTYAYYHEVLRGKTPSKAASYAEEVVTPDGQLGAETVRAVEDGGASKPRYGWRCKLCGYIEMVDELPDDFTCPICGVGKEMFERIEL